MRYHNISKDDILNGNGLRVVLWVSGCSHGCKGCQNPVTWNPDDGILFDDAAKKEIFEQLDKDYIDGVTFSGGDPLHYRNRYEVFELCKEIRQKYPSKTIWLYTGYLYEQIKDWNILKYVDVLCDGEFVEELKDSKLHWVGSSNQRVMELRERSRNNE